MSVRTMLHACIAPIVLSVLLLAGASGCSKNSATRGDRAGAVAADVRTAPLGDTVALHRGESILFGDEILLSFNRVEQDSRCPEDVTCVWAGNARVELTLRKSGGASIPLLLNTGVAPRDTSLDRYHIALHALAPTPNSRRVIEPDQYVASVSVTRR